MKYRQLLPTLVAHLMGLVGVLSQTIDIGSFTEGTKIVLFNEGLTGSKSVDYSFTWSNENVDPVAIINPDKLVTNLQNAAPGNIIDILYSDLSSEGTIRTVYLTRPNGVDNAIYISNTNSSLTWMSGMNCSVYNNRAQINPFIAVCYRVMYVENKYNKTVEEPGEVPTCFHENNQTTAECSLLNNTNSINYTINGAVAEKGYRRRMLPNDNITSSTDVTNSDHVLNSTNVTNSKYVVNSLNVSNSENVFNSITVYIGSKDVTNSNYVKNGTNILNSNSVRHSINLTNVNNSTHVNDSGNSSELRWVVNSTDSSKVNYSTHVLNVSNLSNTTYGKNSKDGSFGTNIDDAIVFLNITDAKNVRNVTNGKNNKNLTNGINVIDTTDCWNLNNVTNCSASNFLKDVKDVKNAFNITGGTDIVGCTHSEKLYTCRNSHWMNNVTNCTDSNSSKDSAHLQNCFNLVNVQTCKDSNWSNDSKELTNCSWVKNVTNCTDSNSNNSKHIKNVTNSNFVNMGDSCLNVTYITTCKMSMHSNRGTNVTDSTYCNDVNDALNCSMSNNVSGCINSKNNNNCINVTTTFDTNYTFHTKDVTVSSWVTRGNNCTLVTNITDCTNSKLTNHSINITNVTNSSFVKSALDSHSLNRVENAVKCNNLNDSKDVLECSFSSKLTNGKSCTNVINVSTCSMSNETSDSENITTTFKANFTKNSLNSSVILRSTTVVNCINVNDSKNIFNCLNVSNSNDATDAYNVINVSRSNNVTWSKDVVDSQGIVNSNNIKNTSNCTNCINVTNASNLINEMNIPRRYVKRLKIGPVNKSKEFTEWIPQWVLSEIRLNLTNNPFTMHQSTLFNVNATCNSSTTNTWLDLVPTTCANYPAFYTAWNSTVHLLWAKPRNLYSLASTDLNNTDIILLSRFENDTIERYHARIQLPDNFSKIMAINDVRAIYETYPQPHIILLLTLYYNSSNSEYLVRCVYNETAKNISSCQNVSGYGSVGDYKLSFVDTSQKQSNYELVFANQGDPRPMRRVLENSTELKVNEPVYEASISYAGHTISKFNFGQNVFYNSNPAMSSMTKMNTNFAGKAFFGIQTSSYYLNPHHGYLFNFNDKYRMFKKTQNEANFVIKPSNMNGQQTFSFAYTFPASAAQTKNVKLEYKDVNSFNNYEVKSMDNQQKCWYGRVCKLYHDIDLKNSFDARYEFIGQQAPALASIPPYFNMVVQEIIVSDYSAAMDANTGTSPTSGAGFFPIGNFYVRFKPSNNNNVKTFQVLKCITFDARINMINYYCSGVDGVFDTTEVPGMPRLLENSNVNVSFRATSGVLLMETKCTSMSISNYTLTMRYPIPKHFVKTTYNEFGPYESYMITNGTWSQSVFLTIDGQGRFKITMVGMNNMLAATSPDFQVAYSMIVETRVNKFCLVKTDTDNQLVMLKYNSTSNPYGFNITRIPVTTNGGNFVFGTAQDIEITDLNFPSTVSGAYICASSKSFGVFINSWTFYLGNWRNDNSASNKPAFYYEEQLYKYYEIVVFKCVQSIDSAIMLVKVPNIDELILLVYNLNDVSVGSNTATTNVRLIASAGADSDLWYVDEKIHIRIGARYFLYKMKSFNLRFGLQPQSTNTSKIVLKTSFTIPKSKETSSKNLELPFSIVRDKADVTITAPLKSNLTAKVPMDTFANFDGHVGELRLQILDLMKSSAVLSPRINSQVDNVTADTIGLKNETFPKFSSHNGVTAMMRSIDGSKTILEVKYYNSSNKLNWGKNVSKGCSDIQVVNFNNVQTFLLALKCSGPIGPHLYFLTGDFKSTIIDHMVIQLDPEHELSKMTVVEGSSGITGKNSIVALTNPLLKYVTVLTIPFTTVGFATQPVPLTTFTKKTISGIFSACSGVKTMVPSVVFVCTQPRSKSITFIPVDSLDVIQDVKTSVFDRPGFYSYKHNCHLNFTSTSTSNTIRCIFASTTELMMVDYNAGSSDFSRVAYSNNQPNPRIFNAYKDYEVQSIAATQHFIGIIASNLYNTIPDWSLQVYHIDSNNMINYTRQTNNPYLYAAYNLSTDTTDTTKPKFFDSEVFSYMDSLGSPTTPEHANYFMLQSSKGSFQVFRIDPFQLSLNLNMTREIMDIVYFDSGSISSLPPNTKLDVVIDRLAGGNKNSEEVKTNSTTDTKNSKAIYWYVGGGVAAVAVLGAVAYYLLSKPAMAATTLGVELKYHSGVLSL